MRKACFILALAVLVLAALQHVASAQKVNPDLILFNGKIFTANASRLYVEALAIRGERIVAAGTSKEVIALAAPNTKRIDLGGRTVIPGINDAHMHLGIAPAAYHLPLKGIDPGWREITDALGTAVSKAPKGTWIVGVFGATVLDDPQATRKVLDAIAPDHLVLLFDWTGHASLLNTAAMRKLAIQDNEPDPEGGRYWRNPADGKLTGMALEFANFRVSNRFAALADDAEAIPQLQKSFDEAIRFGITSMQDMALPIPADHCVALLGKAPPPIRVRVIWFGLTDENGRLLREGRPSDASGPPLVTISGRKWILDGTPIEHSAAMRQPYSDRSGTTGDLNFSQMEMKAMLREDPERNDQLMVHVVGDRSVETFLNAMDSTGGEKVWATRRIRLEHGDGLMPDLIPSAKRLGVVVVQNPTHFTLPDLFVKRFGQVRSSHLTPLRSLIEAGIPVAFGSDGPMNPYLNIMLAASHPENPKEAVTREQAVIAYTLTSAYAEFAENEKGSIEPGKLADLAVLSQDIFTVPADDLPKTESVLTVVGGKIVYDSKALVVQ